MFSGLAVGHTNTWQVIVGVLAAAGRSVGGGMGLPNAWYRPWELCQLYSGEVREIPLHLKDALTELLPILAVDIVAVAMPLELQPGSEARTHAVVHPAESIMASYQCAPFRLIPGVTYPSPAMRSTHPHGNMTICLAQVSPTVPETRPLKRLYPIAPNLLQVECCYE